MKMNKVGIIFKLLVVNSEERERKDLRRGRESRHKNCQDVQAEATLTFSKKSSTALRAVPSSGAKNPNTESLT